MSDGKYFSTTKKGEIHEFKEELRSLEKSKKKDGVKKVIAAMTVGKDVAMLFPDMMNCMQTEDLELKKLVYLYCQNYAKTQPDLAIMAVNTFVKDSQDPNPLIRALAVRTMGCIRVDKITEYLCDPLQRCLKDDDPYVRKTAAICVAKLFDINPELVDDRGFLDQLRDLLSDANPMVVANALAALQEIQEISGKDMLQLSQNTLMKLLTALNDCTEWGQVFILDALAGFETRDPRDAEKIAERVLPRMQHVNSAVVLSAIKVILRMMDICQSADLVAAWSKKMAPPLVTLLGAEPEVQYVALRNINLVVQKRPSILANEVKVFFCKYNDPIYVKMEKLEIMIKLASDKNIDQVLLEFKEYAQEVDVDFVRKAVRAIGRCAVSIERAAEKCINVLLELIKAKVNYVVQEGVIVIKDIFRRYPNRYENIIATLCENLDSLDEPEAKASMVWIIGEYAERIDNADELLETFLDTFPEENSMVQLQLLTSTVKLFLKKPTESAQKMISLVLSCATNETDNPDLRDRAFIYWRLLSTDPEAAKDVVLAQKPVITDDVGNLDQGLLDQLLRQVATLSSVYHKPPEMFVSRQRLAVQKADELQDHQFEEEEVPGAASTSTAAVAAAATSAAPQVDLLNLDSGGPEAAAAPPRAVGGIDDLLGGLDISSTSSSTPAPQLPVLLSDPSKGLVIQGKILRQGGTVTYALVIINSSASPLDGLMLQTNRSTFGLGPVNVVLQVPSIAPSSTATALVPMLYDSTKILPGAASSKLEVAMKTNQAGVLYFADAVPLASLLEESGGIEGQAFLNAWKTLPPETPQRLQLTVFNIESAKQRLQAANLFVLAHRPVPGTSQEALYLTGKVGGINVQVLVEVRLTVGVPGMDVSFKSERTDLATMTFEAVAQILA
ncbi:hypothetical protein CEUSTIGMA_g10651.t1 [Chlamydomonas eustigma]|uniref:Beta-adaptin-like protein n=1 Tax=Chlamydomonas eustigma TaxID=1157962 RepID=A0A250XJG4_9CHLO|nr:hypothetical protein CEUSTIGMA_g10651.t1 [Chlamydomonas eustigma]|eukprot:GAX83225.1 hypothetical protein CEUSTIGMA_g10651.t1 [Chlamydomonas eustigma]